MTYPLARSRRRRERVRCGPGTGPHLEEDDPFMDHPTIAESRPEILWSGTSVPRLRGCGYQVPTPTPHSGVHLPPWVHHTPHFWCGVWCAYSQLLARCDPVVGVPAPRPALEPASRRAIAFLLQQKRLRSAVL